MAAGYLLPSLPWTPLVKGISAVVHGVMCRDLISCCSRLAPQGNFEVTSFSPRVTNFAGEMKKLCAGLYLLSPHRQGGCVLDTFGSLVFRRCLSFPLHVTLSGARNK